MKKQNNSKQGERLGVIGLSAIVLSAMLGGGIFDLPKNMAACAGPLGTILAWAIAGIGMWFVTSMFLNLTELKPNLTTGLYKYGEAGFGKFTGFFVSWGYWVCESFSNVAYAILLMSTLNYFFPGDFSGGNNWAAVIGGSIVLWGMSLIILFGVRQASWVNLVGTIVRLAAVAIFIIAVAAQFRWIRFSTNFTATRSFTAAMPAMGHLGKQVILALPATLWAFGGIEGAVVLSDRAKSQRAVRQATAIGFFGCLALYMLVSLLPMGMKPYGVIAKVGSPSTAGLLTMALHSPAGRVIMAGGLLVSVFSCWLTWTMMLMEMPYAAAKDGAFPRIFARESKNHVPVISLLAATLLMQVVLLVAHFANNAFQLAYTVVATMTVPPYMISALYLVKLALRADNFPGNKGRIGALITGILAVLYTVMMGLVSGVKYVMIAFVVYALGIPLFIKARHEQAPGEPVFTRGERWFAAAIIIIAVGAILVYYC